MTAAAFGCSFPEEVARPADYADPRIGTGGFAYYAGCAFPGAAAPQGMAKVGPDTSGEYGTVFFLHASGYWAGDDTVEGFSHMHLTGAGQTDYGVVSLMPTDAAGRTTRAEYGATFSKDTEAASPGYYAVTLDRGAVRAELTATSHAAHHRYAFGSGGSSRVVVLDLDHHLAVSEVPDAELTLFPGEQRIAGKLHLNGELSKPCGGFDVFFEAHSRKPWSSARVWSKGVEPAEGTHAAGVGVGAELVFDPADAAPVEIQVGLSLVDADGAKKNLDAEMPGWDFDGTRKRTSDDWNALLSSIRVAGGTEDERRIFYSSLYRMYLMPTIQSDVDGRYRGADHAVHTAEGFRYVTDLSLWDTYRTLHPLYTLISPDRARDAVRSLMAMAEQGGFFPKWPLACGDAGTMVGSSADIVVADTYLRGVTDFDAPAAYRKLRAAALGATPPAGGRGGREHVEAYDALGYVPADVKGSVSLSMEFAHEDFALGNLADALGESADATRFAARSKSYRNLFDPAAGFLRARNADGTFPAGDFNPLLWIFDYTEANAWQSLWMAAHDLDGLAALLGGREAFVAKLEEMFEKTEELQDALRPDDLESRTFAPPYYWHGNEPDIHAPYLFAQAGRPDLAQKWVRWIMTHDYTAAPDGIMGNDDAGTLSAWYVWSALGLYPLPGTDQLILGAPLFPRAHVEVTGGRLAIDAPAASPKNIYARRVRLDGREVAAPTLRQRDLKAGSTLSFEMTEAP